MVHLLVVVVVHLLHLRLERPVRARHLRPERGLWVPYFELPEFVRVNEHAENILHIVTYRLSFRLLYLDKVALGVADSNVVPFQECT